MPEVNKASSVSKEMLHFSIEWGNELRRESDALSMAFRGFNSPSYDIAVFQKMLNQYKNYERKAPELLVMKVAYGDIARAYLHVQDFKNALKYGVAYLKINLNEPAGEIAAYKILADIAIASKNYGRGASFFKMAYPEMNQEEQNLLARILESEQKSKENGIKPLLEIPVNLTDVVLPRTFRFLGEDEASMQERTIRMHMHLLQYSRREATGHVQSA